ncbi:DUF6483 family protein [Paenibacillus gansuensis]|uniref:DUF6483 family protein n=1 Tax=Paenibacillus gansuensis TaxID=306542 RepID=A0ABW5PDU9_9BACL
MDFRVPGLVYLETGDNKMGADDLYKRDYLMRLIEQMTEVLGTRLLQLRQEKKQKEGLELIDEQLTKLYLPKSKLLHSVSEEHLLNMFSVNGVPESDKMAAAGLLLRHQADIYKDMEIEADRANGLRKALFLLLAAKREGFDPDGLTGREISGLLKEMNADKADLPALTELFLMDYYTGEGRYDAAENLLYRLPHKLDSGVYEVGKRFYDTLFQLDDQQLMEGNFSREEAEDGWKEWQQKYKPNSETINIEEEELDT